MKAQALQALANIKAIIEVRRPRDPKTPSKVNVYVKIWPIWTP